MNTEEKLQKLFDEIDNGRREWYTEEEVEMIKEDIARQKAANERMNEEIERKERVIKTLERQEEIFFKTGSIFSNQLLN